MRDDQEILDDLSSPIAQVLLASKAPRGPIERLIQDIPLLLRRERLWRETCLDTCPLVVDAVERQMAVI